MIASRRSLITLYGLARASASLFPGAPACSPTFFRP